jgi:hypothetical protein
MLETVKHLLDLDATCFASDVRKVPPADLDHGFFAQPFHARVSRLKGSYDRE